MRFPLAALAVAALLAGCTSAPTEPTGTTGPAPYVRPGMPADPLVEGAGHDHNDPAAHKFLWNYGFSAHDPLLQNGANTAGVHAIDLQNGYLFGAVYGSHTASVDGGLVIWDVKTDPAHPRQTGRWVIPGSVGGDRSMEATPDGDFAVISTEAVDCLGHINLGAAVSAYLIDARNKMAPVVADVITLTGQSTGDLAAGGLGRGVGAGLGEHSVAVHRIGGADYAFVFGKIYRIERSETRASLVYVSEINSQVEKHDIYVRDTPFGTTWALAADGRSNLMLVWDVTDPAHPFAVGRWEVPDKDTLRKEGVEYYIHTADVSFQDGMPVVVVTSEDFGPHVSPLWILDGRPMRDATAASGPANLTTIGGWHNPGNHDATATLAFSLHNPRFHDGGILTISMYHGGIWQLDARHPDLWADPAPIAYEVYADGSPTAMQDPAEGAVQSQLCGLASGIESPEVMDVEVGPNGILYAADVFSGLMTFTPTDSHPVYGANRTADYTGTDGI